MNGQSDKERLIGSWRHIGSTVDGKPRQGQGANPKGIIIYDAHGYMACHVAPDREDEIGARIHERLGQLGVQGLR